jgi:LacI family transcriptional regulator
MESMSKTTIHDIAQMAGVCIATVSRVINNKDNVLPETRQRVLDLIDRTGYRPNAMGRGLVLRRSHNILFEHFNIADPYCVAMANRISDRCRTIGCRMLLADCKRDTTLEAEHLMHVRDGSVDGLIISPLPGRDNLPRYRDLVRAGFPVVLIDNVVPGVRMHCVKYDDRAAGAIAMEYLFEKGHRRIAFIQCRHSFHTVLDRRWSYRQCHRKHRIPVDPDLTVTLPFAFSQWDQGVFQRLLALPLPPTALLTENEIVAVATMNVLMQAGVRIPDDVAVMAIGDTLLDSLVPVPLTTISLHPDQAADKAVDLLAKLIEDSGVRQSSPRVIIQKPSLVVRTSA